MLLPCEVGRHGGAILSNMDNYCSRLGATPKAVQANRSGGLGIGTVPQLLAAVGRLLQTGQGRGGKEGISGVACSCRKRDSQQQVFTFNTDYTKQTVYIVLFAHCPNVYSVMFNH